MKGDQTICGACSAELGRALTSVRWLARELETTLTRQTSRTGGGRSAEVPLPFDPRASELTYVLRNTLVGWVRTLMEITPGESWPGDSCESMAAWLSDRRQRLVTHPAAIEAYEELVTAVEGAERIVDRPAERVFAGRCECGAALYARPGAPQVSCRECDAEPHDVAAKREEMLAQVEDQLATAAQAAHILTRLAAPLRADLVRKWGERGRLIHHGTDPHGHPLYRVSDVLELLVAKLTREEELRAKREAEQHKADTDTPANAA
jgi:hypothetical protein